MTTILSSSLENSSDLLQQIALNPLTLVSTMNQSSILYTEQFPDALQNLSTEQCRAICTALAETNNASLVNKRGQLGGYTALAWMCIKNELELIEFLITKCKADVNTKANLGESPLFICIKYCLNRLVFYNQLIFNQQFQIRNCNIYTIELLIEYGADVNARDSYQ